MQSIARRGSSEPFTHLGGAGLNVARRLRRTAGSGSFARRRFLLSRSLHSFSKGDVMNCSQRNAATIASMALGAVVASWALMSANPVAMPTVSDCCCAPAHESLIVTGTCGSCFNGAHDCSATFEGTVVGASCKNYRIGSSCALGGSSTITPTRYQCSTAQSCGSGGETQCTYTAAGTGPDQTVAGCGANDTTCPAGTSMTECN